MILKKLLLKHLRTRIMVLKKMIGEKKEKQEEVEFVKEIYKYLLSIRRIS